MILRNSFNLFALFLLLASVLAYGAEVPAGVGIVPDPSVFLQASNFMNAAGMKAKGDVIETLRRGYADRWDQLVPQLLLFSFRAGDKKAMVASAILGQLNIPQEAFAGAVAPYLDCDNEDFRRDIYHYMGAIDEIPGRSPADPDFTVYAKIIKSSPTNSPQGLIRYMYRKSPQNAVLSMARIYGDKSTEAEVANHLQGDPKAALRSLADRPEWWAHLYVAETMKKRPELRDSAILKKLEKNDNPLVKAKVAEITSGK
jgi:hypothetical protein